MKIYWNEVREKTTGTVVTYLYKQSWGQRYYSFNNGESWHPSRREAYLAARETNSLQPSLPPRDLTPAPQA